MNPFSQFLTSVVSIRKPDGKITAEKINAGVDNSSIEIHDTALVIDRNGYFPVRNSCAIR